MDSQRIEDGLGSSDSGLRTRAFAALLHRFRIKMKFETIELESFVLHCIGALGDNNKNVQLRALQATAALIQHYPLTTSTTVSICHNVIRHSLWKPFGVGQAGMNILTTLIEIGHQRIVLQQLLRGLDQQDTRAGCVEALLDTLRQFGPKIVSAKVLSLAIQPLQRSQAEDDLTGDLKLLVKEACPWFDHSVLSWIPRRKKNIREKTKEILQNQSPQKIKLFEYHRAAVDRRLEKMNSTGFLMLRALNEGVNLWPFDMLTYEDADFITRYRLLGKMSRFTSGKFTDEMNRNEILRKYDTICQTLQWVIDNENLSMLIIKAAACIGSMAQFPTRWFCPHAAETIQVLLTKVTTNKAIQRALRQALDECLSSTSISEMTGICMPLLKHHSPLVRGATVDFMARFFPKMPPPAAQELFEASVESLLKLANDRSSSTRHSVFKVIGAATLILGPGKTMPLLESLNKFQRMKIEESCLTVCTEENERYRRRVESLRAKRQKECRSNSF